MTNSERRITYLSKGINPPGEALSHIEIITRFAKKMNFSGFDYASTEEIYREHALLTKNTTIRCLVFKLQSITKRGFLPMACS